MFLASQLAAIGGYTFSEHVPTAGTDGTSLIINPDFWKRLNQLEQQFLLDHEMMHITCDHHKRMANCRSFMAGATYQKNMAADLSINGILYDQYVGRENPEAIIPTLWKVGIFPQQESIKMPVGLTAEEYFDLLNNGNGNLFGALPPWSDVTSYIMRAFAENAAKKIEEYEKEAEGFSTGCQGFQADYEKIKLRKKKCFSTLMKELVGNTSLMDKMDRSERWAPNNRMPWANLPVERWTETHRAKNRKNRIGLFLDFSGSCRAMASTFAKTAELIPSRYFSVVMHKFADECVKIDSLKEDVCARIGGGTHFDSIIPFHEKLDQVWIFTDGQGVITPSKLAHNRFIWFFDQVRPNNHLPQSHRFEYLSNYVIAE